MQRIIIYKGKASMMMDLVEYKPAVNPAMGERVKARDASIMLTFAKSVGPRKYDTENATKIALTYLEATALYYTVERKKHPGAGEQMWRAIHKNTVDGTPVTKILSVSVGKQAGTFGWGLKVGDDSTSVFTTTEELYAITTFLNIAIPKMIDPD